jgi:hypothetical protein
VVQSFPGFASVETARERQTQRIGAKSLLAKKLQAYRFARLPAPSSVSHLPVALPFRM